MNDITKYLVRAAARTSVMCFYGYKWAAIWTCNNRKMLIQRTVEYSLVTAALVYTASICAVLLTVQGWDWWQQKLDHGEQVITQYCNGQVSPQRLVTTTLGRGARGLVELSREFSLLFLEGLEALAYTVIPFCWKNVYRCYQ
jgi:hypothetical protein